MSEPNKRRPNDAYFTPDALAEHLVGLLPLRFGENAWEPHAGGGAFVRALSRRLGVRHVYATDIDPAPYEGRDGKVQVPDCSDFLLESGGPRAEEWIVGNPPFNQAQEHVEQALKLTGRHVAFLLRLGFLASGRRAEFWERHPARHIWVLSQRPSFTGGGTDSQEYGFFWWDTDPSQAGRPTTISCTSWKKSKRSVDTSSATEIPSEDQAEGAEVTLGS